MSKFKIGDRVRAKEDNGWVEDGAVGTVAENDDVPYVNWDDGSRLALHESKMNIAFTISPGTFYRTRSGKPTGRVTVGDTGFEATVEGRVRIYDAAGGAVHGGDDIVEVWAPKVGERVRCAMGCGDATVKYFAEGGKFLVDWDDGTVGVVPWLAGKDFEPLPVAAPQPALVVTAGKFYRTRDGRKVGPMEVWRYGGWHSSKSDAPLHGGLWESSGKPKYPAASDSPDLIAEWQETTNVGAQVDTLAEEYGPASVAVVSNDNATKPKFKVGDRISGYAPAWGDKTGVITKVDETDRNQFYRIRDEDSGFGMWLENYSVKPAPSTTQTTAIVALIEDGKPKPADIPHVHANQAAAELEAKRLAGAHKGKQFGVYVLASTAEEPAPVYAHEWQRLAADGRRPLAVSSLVRTAGIPQGHAERIVGQFAA